jgi:hypothetical protein
MSASIDGGAVQVLDRQRVAGFDAVVLAATDAEKLRQWLQKHGYDARPALTAWLAPYVKAGWIITAFQIAKNDGGSEYFSTSAVRMSFTAERPFFPYSEPQKRDNPAVGPGRLLRVFLVANQRMQGAFDDPKTAWPQGKAVWAGQLDQEKQGELKKRLDARTVPLPEGAWLTVFDDYALVRKDAGDIYFSPAANQSELRRPPIMRDEIIYYPSAGLIAGGVIVVLLLVGPPLWWIIRRFRAKAV